ncbi:MAG: beta strand repeat-containing protein, partial [Chlamydiales bacterium]
MLFSQDTSTWQVDGSGTWNVPGNWGNGIVPQHVDDVAIFGNSNTQPNPTIGLGQPITIGTLDIDNPNLLIFQDSNALTFQTTSGNAQLNLTSINGGGQLLLALPTILNSNLAISVDTGAGGTINNVISGAGGITITGLGGIIFSSNTGNTYTGTTTISGGNLFIDTNAQCLQDVVVENGGSLTFDNTSSVKSLNIISGTVTGSIIFPNGGNVLTMGGQTLNGNFSFTDAGGATITYNPSPGATAVITGGDLNVMPDATYTFNIGSGGGTPSVPDMELNVDFLPPVNSSATFVKTGLGVLLYDPGSVSGNNAGPTTVNQGTLVVNTQAEAGVPGDLIITGGTLLCGGADQISHASNVTLSSGTLDFGGFAQTIGSFTFQSGTFSQGGNPLVLTSTSSALTMRNTSISGPVQLVGDIAFDATNGGTATLSGPLNINTTAGAVTRTFTIGGSSANGMTINNVISNTGSTGIVKAGTGTLTFAGAGPNTYTGASTAVNAGTLALNVTTGPAVPSTAVMISSGATIDVQGINQLNANAAVTVNGTLNLNGHNTT